MYKRLALIILCVLMLLCLAACGENSNDSTENTPVNTEQSQPANSSLNIQPRSAVFETENIVRITFYSRYGDGTACEVPQEHMAEITNWLASFTIGEEAPEIPSPGTNTYRVEIEYADGTIAESGLDTTVAGDIVYKIQCAPEPDCYAEIIASVRG